MKLSEKKREGLIQILTEAFVKAQELMKARPKAYQKRRAQVYKEICKIPSTRKNRK